MKHVCSCKLTLSIIALALFFSLVGCSRESDIAISYVVEPLGRYTETEVSLPSGLENIIGLQSGADASSVNLVGTVSTFDNNAGAQLIWYTADKDTLEWTEAAKISLGSIQNVTAAAWDSTDTLYVCYPSPESSYSTLAYINNDTIIPVYDIESDTPIKSINISAGNEVVVQDKYDVSAFSSDGEKIITVADAEAGSSDTEVTSKQETYAVSGNKLVLIEKGEMLFYSLDTSSPALDYTISAPSSSPETQQVMTTLSDGTWALMNSSGLYRVVYNSSMLEQIFDSSIGNPMFPRIELLGLTELGQFTFLLLGHNGSGYVMYKYTYDAEAPVFPETIVEAEAYIAYSSDAD